MPKNTLINLAMLAIGGSATIALLATAGQAAYYVHRGTQLSRDGLAYLNYLGGSMDSDGHYSRQVSADYAFGAPLADGEWDFPAKWDDRLGVRVQVENGRVTRIGYRY